MESFASAMATSAPRAIACAVLVQAIKDFRRVSKRERAGDRIATAEARRFLTDERGAWAQSREDWCLIAEFDPARLRNLAVSGKLDGVEELFKKLSGQHAASQLGEDRG